MKPFPGVHQRPGTTFWWFYVTVPKDLAHHFPSQWATRESLKTRDLREANARAKVLTAEWEGRFAALRAQDNPQRVTLTPALVATVAAEVRRWVLEADDNLRDFPEGPRGLLAAEERRRLLALAAQAEESPLAGLLPAGTAAAGLTIRAPQQARAEPPQPVPEEDPLAGLSSAEVQAVAGFNARAEGAAAVALAGRNLRAALPLAEAVTRSLGLQVDWTSPEGRAGLLEVLKAHRQATADTARRDAGEVVDTPPQAQPKQGPQEAAGAPQQARQGHTPMDAFNAWEKLKPGRPRKTIEKYRAAADKLATLLEGKTLEQVTREDGRTVVAKLLQEAKAKGGKAQNTAADYLGLFKTLFAQAEDLEWIDRNPFKGRTIEKVKRTRDEWALPELVRLFADPLFTEYRLPVYARAGKDAAYWLPLLGLFTGARISELAQLHTDDIQETEDAGWVLSIHDEREGERVKNAHSVRDVLIHPELVRLGLLDYWRAIKDHGPGPLWPAVIRCEINGAGGEVSKWFGSYKKAKGFGPDRVFHSFRHTMETRLRALSVPQPLINALTGHAGPIKSEADGYAHLKPADVRPSLERLQFPGLDLPRVFKAPAWKP